MSSPLPMLGSLPGALLIRLARYINEKNRDLFTHASFTYTWEHAVMGNPKGWLEFGLMHHFRLNKGKMDFGFWARKAVMGR